jgi:hypothetical protein
MTNPNYNWNFPLDNYDSKADNRKHTVWADLQSMREDPANGKRREKVEQNIRQ